MVKSVLGVNHRGLTDWIIQRISAVIMSIYLFGLVFFFVTHPDTAYYEWHRLFGHFWMKLATGLVFLALFYHTWVGMWTIFTDYIKVAWINLVCQVLVILALIAFYLELLQILWSV
jgi:succinate dehydrogenase / fumarate reductase, membrane anchor subunit